MSLRNKLTGAGLSLGLVLGFGAVAFAQQTESQTPPAAATQQSQERGEKIRHGEKHGRGMDGEMRGGMRMLHELDLTAAQREQAHAIFERFQTNTQAQREELSRLRAQKEQGTLTPEQETRAQQLRKEMHASMKQVHTELLAILTPEQRAKMEQMHQEHKQRHKGPRGEGRDDQNDTP